MTPIDLRVHRVERPVPGVLVAEMQAIDRAALPEWVPGAHVELDLGGGLVRHYSLCGDPGDRETWRIAVLLREDGEGGSALVHRMFAPGHTLRARAVRNRMRVPEVASVQFVAGGIGITPLLPMIREADARGIEWNLVYAGRRRERMYALEELIQAFGNRILPHVSAENGRLDVEMALSAARAPEAIVCCGPASLMAAAQTYAERAGVPCITENFGIDVPDAPARPTASSTDDGFTVSLARSGIEVHVAPDEPVLTALEDAGVPVASSCREGYCGTCETVVLEGAVDHRDTVLTPEEHEATDLMMVCVSRCKGARLVLDL